MYYITKVFRFPIGHRLSKIGETNKCSFLHGHNFSLEVRVKSYNLNEKDMVMDFSDLKKLVNEIIDFWDHAMFLNENDNTPVENCNVHRFDGDPTAEVLCRYLFNEIEGRLPTGIHVDSVSIWETDDSKATYKESENPYI